MNCTGTDTVWTLLAGRGECVSRCFADERCLIAAYHRSTGNCTALPSCPGECSTSVEEGWTYYINTIREGNIII